VKRAPLHHLSQNEEERRKDAHDRVAIIAHSKEQLGEHLHALALAEVESSSAVTKRVTN
jgi:hypothetical protein